MQVVNNQLNFVDNCPKMKIVPGGSRVSGVVGREKITLKAKQIIYLRALVDKTSERANEIPRTVPAFSEPTECLNRYMGKRKSKVSYFGSEKKTDATRRLESQTDEFRSH